MPARCPVCEVTMDDARNLCPHVATLVARNGKSADIVVGGQRLFRVLDVRKLDLWILTQIGWVTSEGPDYTVYFSPNPKVYHDAVLMGIHQGAPVGLTYSDLWITIGMEHENWDKEH